MQVRPHESPGARAPLPPRARWGDRLPAIAAALGIAWLSVLVAPRAAADMLLDPLRHGDCGGAEGTVCHLTTQGREELGLCRKSRNGEIFCATDPDSRKEASERQDVIAARSKRETLWVTTVLGTSAIVLAGTLFLLRRRRRAAETPPGDT